MQIYNRWTLNLGFGIILLTIAWLQFVVSSFAAGLLSIGLILFICILFNILLNKTDSTKISKTKNAENDILEFNDSFSHDLKAPVHAIMGFTQIILEDHGENLKPEVKNLLGLVVSATNKMNQVVEGILNLSKYTRVELAKKQLNLSAIVQDIADKFQQLNSNRQIKFIIQENVDVHGDPQLLKVAMTHLMDNAYKFTSLQAEGCVEFGIVKRQDGEKTYFIRDNGAGFDMRHASKLFRPFQRLHGTHEFPGIGLGLANVQQIVHRHDGKIWAEAEPQKGATFFFSL